MNGRTSRYRARRQANEEDLASWTPERMRDEILTLWAHIDHLNRLINDVVPYATHEIVRLHAELAKAMERDNQETPLPSP